MGLGDQLRVYRYVWDLWLILPFASVCDLFVCSLSLCHSFGFMNVWVGAGEPVLPLVWM